MEIYDSADRALEAAVAWACAEDLICVTGSIFVVAGARRAWAAGHPEAFSPDDWVFQDESEVAIVPDEDPRQGDDDTEIEMTGTYEAGY